MSVNTKRAERLALVLAKRPVVVGLAAPALPNSHGGSNNLGDQQALAHPHG